MKCEQPTSPCWRKLAALRRQPGSGLQLLSQLGLCPARQVLAAWGVMGAGGRVSTRMSWAQGGALSGDSVASPAPAYLLPPVRGLLVDRCGGEIQQHWRPMGTQPRFGGSGQKGKQTSKFLGW